jgi:hypothetical protein
LSGNSIEGVIPAWLANMTSLTSLSLANNQLHGCLPESLSTLPLARLRLEGNPVTGFLTAEMAQFLLDVPEAKMSDSSNTTGSGYWCPIPRNDELLAKGVLNGDCTRFTFERNVSLDLGTEMKPNLGTLDPSSCPVLLSCTCSSSFICSLPRPYWCKPLLMVPSKSPPMPAHTTGLLFGHTASPSGLMLHCVGQHRGYTD